MAAGSVGAQEGGRDNGDGGGGGGSNGNQPWYDWEADVNAGGNDLDNLHAVDAEHIYTAARGADRIVWKDEEDIFHADGHDGQVASGEDMITVIQAAVDSLTDDRTSKETVAVVSPGTVGPTDKVKQIELPSYTILNMPVTMTVADEGEPLVIPLRARNAERIEMPNFSLRGNPRYSMWLQSVSNARLGNLYLDQDDTGLGVRIDGFANGRGDDTVRATDIQVDAAYIEGTDTHAFETYAVDRLQVDRIIGVDPTGCVVLLNDTTDATVGSVVGREPGVPAGYATFRVANGAHDVAIGEVVSRGGARGLFGVSECYDITIGAVNIVGARDNGILIQNCQNFTVEGGVVKNSGDAVRIDTRDTGDQIPAEGVCIANLRVYDDREEAKQAYGIHETGPRTNNNRIVNNDVRNGGTEANISIFSDSTIVRDNIGAGVADGTTMLTSGASPAAYIEDMFSVEQSGLESRIEPAITGSGIVYAWESYFEWDGDAGTWNLVFEWQTDPGTDIEVNYIVDKAR